MRKPSSGMRPHSPGLGSRKWGQMGYGLSSMTAAITQPRALQMYQLLDNMELEECEMIKESGQALLDEHVGLLSDLYASTQQVLMPQSYCCYYCDYYCYAHCYDCYCYHKHCHYHCHYCHRSTITTNTI